MLNIADKDKDNLVRAIVETLQKEPPLEVLRVDNSTRVKLFSADEVANVLEEINKTVETWSVFFSCKKTSSFVYFKSENPHVKDRRMEEAQAVFHTVAGIAFIFLPCGNILTQPN